MFTTEEEIEKQNDIFFLPLESANNKSYSHFKNKHRRQLFRRWGAAMKNSCEASKKKMLWIFNLSVLGMAAAKKGGLL